MKASGPLKSMGLLKSREGVIGSEGEKKRQKEQWKEERRKEERTCEGTKKPSIRRPVHILNVR